MSTRSRFPCRIRSRLSPASVRKEMAMRTRGDEEKNHTWVPSQVVEAFAQAITYFFHPSIDSVHSGCQKLM